LKSTAVNLSDWVVLIIDDEPDNLDIPRQLLVHYGAAVHAVETGQEALDFFENTVPSIVLLDISMPDIDGWDMINYIKSTQRTAHIPVIAVTAHAMVGDRERILAAGFDKYISKPFSTRTFIDDIKGFIEKA